MGGVVHGYDTAMRSHCRTNRYRGLSEFQFCTALDEAATTKTQLAALEFIKSMNKKLSPPYPHTSQRMARA